MQKKDYLNRQQKLDDLMSLITVLSKSKKSCTFALEGKWGCGKSFFVDLFQEKASILQCEETCDDAFFIVKYDCWKYNYYSDPFVPMVLAVQEAIKKELDLFPNWKGRERVSAAIEALAEHIKKYGAKIIENKIGLNPLELYNEAKGAIDDIEDQRSEKTRNADTDYFLNEILHSIHEQLKEISERRTIIFIVDELDRCLPEYAIKILEQVHHIFSQIPNFISILVINEIELRNIIRMAYGSEVKSDAYLRKIIDFYFKIDAGKPADNYLHKYGSYMNRFCWEGDDLNWVNAFMIELLKEEYIRDQEKLFNKAELLHDIFCENKIDISCMVFEILYLKLQDVRIIKDYLEDKLSLKNSRMKFSCNHDGREYKILSDDIVSRVVWYVENVEMSEENGYCGKYYNPHHMLHRENVGILKKIAKMSKVIE